MATGPNGRWARPALIKSPSLVTSALALVWSVSPARAGLAFGTQFTASILLFAQVVLIDRVLRVIFDVVGSDGSTSSALVPVALLAVLSAATAVAANVAQLQQRVLGEFVARGVWQRVLDVNQAVPLTAFEDPDYYDQAERIESKAASRTQIVVEAVVSLSGDLLGVVAGTVAVLALAPALAPLLLISAIPLLITSRMSGRLEFSFATTQSTPNRQRTYLQELLTRREAAREVRAFSLSAFLRARWEGNYEDFLDALRRLARRRTGLILVGNLAAAIPSGAAMILAVVLVDRGRLDIASAGAAIVAVRLLSSRVTGVTWNLSTLFESSLFLRDLQEFLARDPERARPRGPSPGTFRRLTVSDVTFTYPHARLPSLSNVSMEISQGEVVALVGENGSGKSTLARILAGLYEAEGGTVTWDGVDVRDYDPESLRRNIAVVLQDFARYQFSARDNIALGHPSGDADDDSIRMAAQQADADEFLSALPAGYDTVLSKEYANGTDLSVGQWQRVALARAFIRNAPFIILDEPTAAIDARAEQELFERMRTLFRGRTVLLISHRFSTVRSADRIYVMSSGAVIEQGDHAALMARGGAYAQLFELQARGYLADSVNSAHLTDDGP